MNMNNIGEKVTKSDCKKLFNMCVTNEIKQPLWLFQNKNYETMRNYIRNYAEDNGMYFVELDEFTDIYIDKVVNLYKEMSDNDFCIIYYRMYDSIDYKLPHHQNALRKLDKVLDRHNNNMQFVIDYHITSNDFDLMEAFAGVPVLNIWRNCYVYRIMR